MRSIKEIYKIGKGPSSSHTMGPARAMEVFLLENPTADAYEVILYGSLADTGRGHGTDKAIQGVARGKTVSITFDTSERSIPHENTMDIFAIRGGERCEEMRVMSVGGGDIEIEGRKRSAALSVYRESSFDEISALCKRDGIRLSEYVRRNEGEEITAFLLDVWEAMKGSINRGLRASGVLPGGLSVERKAKQLYEKYRREENTPEQENRIVCAYAYAASEENADNGTVVTAPTCGACAVVPSVLKYMQDKYSFSDERIASALAVAGLIGNIIKTNASISGAECGCQAEIGAACSMAAAALAELLDFDIDQIEYSAEIALEHHLGLTCDPICGLVQIPCIERNAVAAMRAINAMNLAEFLYGSRKISFDTVVETMYETGKDMSRLYRETSGGGLAKLYRR